MSHQTQDTSLLAYYGEVMETIGDKHRAVLKVFGMNPYRDFTNGELAEELSWPINTVTPRVYELRGMDEKVAVDPDNPILIHTQTRKCGITHRTAMAWGMNPEYKRSGYKLWKEMRK